jgi:AcrR family transcriptional regulator
MEERTQRIVETAIELAERDGYEAVRLREVARQAGVALGTVYRRFTSKEEILAAALQHEIGRLQSQLGDAPVWGEGAPVDRVVAYFSLITRFLVARPNLARALIRAVSSGVPDVAARVTRFHGTMTDLVVSALKGKDPAELDISDVHLAHVGYHLQNAWFAEVVGWASGLNQVDEVIAHTRTAAELLVEGARAVTRRDAEAG